MYTIEEKLTELKRELATRQRVYPGWIQRGQISKELAAQRIAIMKELVSDYQKLHDQQNPIQGHLFNTDHQK